MFGVDGLVRWGQVPAMLFCGWTDGLMDGWMDGWMDGRV